jgi:hypothetical protein
MTEAYERALRLKELTMLNAYINYPNQHIETHAQGGCGSIRQHNKTGQRVVDLAIASLSLELKKFVENKYSFAPNAAENDMWLCAEFADPLFERAVVDYIVTLLGKRYKNRFGNVRVRRHC